MEAALPDHNLLRDQHLLDVRLRQDPGALLRFAMMYYLPFGARPGFLMTSRLRIPSRGQSPLLPLAGLVNDHPKVPFHLSSETPGRIIEHTSPCTEALVLGNGDRVARSGVIRTGRKEWLPAGRLDNVRSGRGAVARLPRLHVPMPRKAGRVPHFRLFTNRLRLADERRAFGILNLEKCIRIREHQRML